MELLAASGQSQLFFLDETLILGGIELPLILRDEFYKGIPFLDTTMIHAEHAANQLFGYSDKELQE